MPTPDRLRIAFLTYRGNPYCGGQGIYTREVTRALSDLGHEVTVFSGQPWPEIDEPARLVRVPGLDLYRADNPFRTPWPYEFTDRIDVAEFATMLTMGFPEPWAFSRRVARILTAQRTRFDLVHDNQCLGSGLLDVMDAGVPMLATIHHPITVDRTLAIASAPNAWKRFGWKRWYGFVDMQQRVARQMPRVVTVSTQSRSDIIEQMDVPAERINVVHVGVDDTVFAPRPDVARVAGRLITTASSDAPTKGLLPLLDAIAKVRVERPEVTLTIIGTLREGSPIPSYIERLDLTGAITVRSAISQDALVHEYACAEIAVVPSLYEGFSLPAIEAMASGVPLIATSGGALPEVVGRDGDAARVVAPGDADALARALLDLLADPDARARLGAAGRARVQQRFTWSQCAAGVVDAYRALIDSYPNGGRARPC